MKKHKILYMVAYDGDPERLSIDGSHGDPSREADVSDITIDAMAQMLDQDAENGNYHDFVGCHAKLAKIFSDRCKPIVAKELMRDLCDVGGLHGMKE